MYLSFYILTLSFLAGVAVRSVAPVAIFDVLFVFVLGSVFALLAALRRAPAALYIVLVLFAGSLGMVRAEYAFFTFEAEQIYTDGTRFAGEGFIAAEPDVREEHTILFVDVQEYEQAHTVRVRAKVPHYPAFAYGDRVQVRGTLSMPEAFETETGRVFDYACFLRKDHVHYELRYPEVEPLTGVAGNPIRRALFALKHQWLAGVSQIIPEPMASLAGGVIVGAKQSLGEVWLERFRETGVIHIVVLSGFNLTIVAFAIMWLCKRFSPRVGTGLAILGIIAFALMTGGGATVVRASIMAIIGMFVLRKHETRTLVRMLVLAAVAMVAWNPFVLVFDTGFQLSFVATLGLVLGLPILLPYLGWMPAALGLRDILGATVATQIAVVPILLYSIGDVSLIAPIVNVLILPLVPLSMLLGFLAGVLALLAPALALPTAWMSYVVFGYMFAVVEFFAALPLASVSLPPVPLWTIVLLYACLGVAVWYAYRSARMVAGGLHA